MVERSLFKKKAVFMKAYYEIPFHWLDENGGSIDSNIDHLDCSESALLWAALTVGAPSHAVFIQNIIDAPAFALHKWFAILSVVDFRDNRILWLKDSYRTLDPSEKGVLSYWTGMIFAKLVAEQVLRVPWMAHARLMKVSGVLEVTPRKTKSLPDLVGYSDSPDLGPRWHVVEAKGLQNNPSPKNKQHYKDQISVVESIFGETEITRNYCITYLRSPLSIDLHDPEDVAKESIKIDATPMDILKFYYKPFFAFFKDSAKDSATLKKKFLYKKILCDPSCKKCCCIGIAKNVFDLVEKWELGEDTAIDEKSNPLKNIDFSELMDDEFFREGDVYLGSDGIFVKIIVNDL